MITTIKTIERSIGVFPARSAPVVAGPPRRLSHPPNGKCLRYRKLISESGLRKFACNSVGDQAEQWPKKHRHQQLTSPLRTGCGCTFGSGARARRAAAGGVPAGVWRAPAPIRDGRHRARRQPAGRGACSPRPARPGRLGLRPQSEELQCSGRARRRANRSHRARDRARPSSSARRGAGS